jgi:hypothetical protein
MTKELVFKVKIHKTNDKKKLSTGEVKTYDYGAINIRSPKLAQYAGKKAKVSVKILA